MKPMIISDGADRLSGAPAHPVSSGTAGGRGRPPLHERFTEANGLDKHGHPASAAASYRCWFP
jgi:hypothetical protein